MMAEHCTNERLAMTLHSIATALMIVKAEAEPSASRRAWQDIPPRPDTAPKPQGLSNEIMMVADYGTQTARLATAHFIPASPSNR
jgi:hypothetical protein